MIDVPEQAVKLIKAQGYENVFLKRLDALTGREGIVVRRIPSTVTGYDYTRSKELAYLYQVIVRTRSPKEGMETAEELEKLLDGANLRSGNGSFFFVSQETYTPTQELELDESGFYAYEFRIKAVIMI